MNSFKTLFKLMFHYDIRDWSTLVFIFLFPIALLLVLVLSFKSYVPGVDIASQISANVIAFGAAYVGILQVLRTLLSGVRMACFRRFAIFLYPGM